MTVCCVRGLLLICLLLSCRAAVLVSPYAVRQTTEERMEVGPFGGDPRDPSVGYRLIDGVATSSPCCVSWGPGRVDCFIRDEISSIRHWWKEGGSRRQDWTNSNRTAVGDVECVSKAPGRIDVMIQGTDNGFYARAYNRCWGPWVNNEGWIPQTPSCIARTGRIINCAVKGRRNTAYSIDSVDGKWSRYDSIGGTFFSPMEISRRSNSTFDVFGIATRNRLHQKTWSGGWSRWGLVGRREVKGKPVALSMNPDRIDVFVLGMQNQLLQKTWTGRWSADYVDLGGSFIQTPTCLNVDQSIHCFGVGVESRMYRRSYVDGKWSPWFRAYGRFIGRPSCVVSDLEKKEVTCYVRGVSRRILELTYKL